MMFGYALISRKFLRSEEIGNQRRLGIKMSLSVGLIVWAFSVAVFPSISSKYRVMTGNKIRE
jgi:hypothetical protein